MAGFVYFWISLIAFELVISFFYKFTSNGRPIARWDKRFKGTGSVVTVIVIIAAIYYFGEAYLHDTIVAFLATFDITTFPMATFSISFFAFYIAKVMLSNNIKHPTVKSTILICVGSAILAIILFLNGNKI